MLAISPSAPRPATLPAMRSRPHRFAVWALGLAGLAVALLPPLCAQAQGRDGDIAAVKAACESQLGRGGSFRHRAYDSALRGSYGYANCLFEVARLRFEFIRGGCEEVARKDWATGQDARMRAGFVKYGDCIQGHIRDIAGYIFDDSQTRAAFLDEVETLRAAFLRSRRLLHTAHAGCAQQPCGPVYDLAPVKDANDALERTLREMLVKEYAFGLLPPAEPGAQDAE